MLDDVAYFTSKAPSLARVGNLALVEDFGELHCVRCGGPRRVDARARHYNHESLIVVDITCAQCDAKSIAVWYKRDDGTNALALLPRFQSGGIATPHTPASVAYYLAQAQGSKSVGSNSAAVAMYRAALEALLHGEGYEARMLGPKLAQLDAAIKADSAPKWATELETEYLDVLRELGNASIHVDGDVSKQAVLDSALLSVIEQAFHGLLFHVYELTHEKTSRLDALRKAAAAMKK